MNRLAGIVGPVQPWRGAFFCAPPPGECVCRYCVEDRERS